MIFFKKTKIKNLKKEIKYYTSLINLAEETLKAHPKMDDNILVFKQQILNTNNILEKKKKELKKLEGRYYI